MKKIMMFFLSVLVFSACEPIVGDKSIGGVLSENQLDIVVQSTSEGSNEILLENNTKGVGSYWDYIIDKSTKQREVIKLPFMGEMTISFTGLCDGGTVTTTRTVRVTKIDKPVAEEWGVIAGTSLDGKVWVWDADDDATVVYGTAGYGNDYAPGWSTFKLGAQVIEGKVVSPNEEMLFNLNGGANFVKRTSNGTVLESGTFKFDMTKQKVRDDGKVWSIGRMEFSGATILCGSSCWNNTPVYAFDIISLTEDKMVLAWAGDGLEFQVWNEATFWCFKKK